MTTKLITLLIFLTIKVNASRFSKLVSKHVDHPGQISGEELDTLDQFVEENNNFISNDLANLRINSEIKDGQTALHLASSKGQFEAVKMLSGTDAIEIDAKDNENRTPLHLASKAGHTAIATYLVEKGAEIDARTKCQYTPLHMASGAGHTAIATYLVEKGAEIDARTKFQYTPLHLASGAGHTDTVTYLIIKDADIHARTKNQNTPLHWASKAGHTDTATRLIEKGADIHAITKYQHTPLHLASVYRRPKIVSLLLENNADIDTKAPNEKTALGLVVANEKAALRKGVPVETLEDTKKVFELLGQKRAEKMKAADDCLICMEEFTDADAPLPNHVRCEKCFKFYHRHCIKGWYVKGTKTCPNCRKKESIVGFVAPKP